MNLVSEHEMLSRVESLATHVQALSTACVILAAMLAVSLATHIVRINTTCNPSYSALDRAQLTSLVEQSVIPKASRIR